VAFWEPLLVGAGIITALTIIGGFVRKIYCIARRIEDSLGKDKEGRSITERLGRIEHQLFPNGGTSLVDKMNRIEADQHTMQGRMQSMERTLNGILRHMKIEETE
jgi:hypothetical protein